MNPKLQYLMIQEIHGISGFQTETQQISVLHVIHLRSPPQKKTQSETDAAREIVHKIFLSMRHKVLLPINDPTVGLLLVLVSELVPQAILL